MSFHLLKQICIIGLAAFWPVIPAKAGTHMLIPNFGFPLARE